MSCSKVVPCLVVDHGLKIFNLGLDYSSSYHPLLGEEVFFIENMVKLFLADIYCLFFSLGIAILVYLHIYFTVSFLKEDRSIWALVFVEQVSFDMPSIAARH